MTDMLAEVTSWVFSDMADPREFVEKMSPTGSDLHVEGGARTERGRAKERKLAATGLAATSVAGVAGVHAISATVKENKHRTVAAGKAGAKAGKLARVAHVNPVRAAELTGAGFLALHGVELTADALAARSQAKNLRANKDPKRTKIAARYEPGHFTRVEIGKAGLSGLKRVGQFAEHQRRSALMTAQRADVAKPLPRFEGESRGQRNLREKKVVREGDRAARKANRGEAIDSAKAGIRQAAAHPQVQQIADTVMRGIGQAATKPKPKPLIQHPGVLLGGGALAGAAFTQRRRRGPIAARAPQDVVDELEWAGEISKLDTDKRLVFGWASLSKVNGEPYVDRQGDWIPIEETEAAAYKYVKDCRVGGDMHKRAGITKEFGPHKVADLVESFVVTPEKLAKMGLAPDAMPEGWWIGMKVHDDEAWDDIKTGKRTGFSVHGSGIRKDVDL